MRILLDLDGIVVNLADAWYSQYNEKYGDNVTVEKVTSWDTSLAAKHGAAIFDILRRPGFYQELKPMPGAVEGVQRLVDLGHEPIIVTATAKDAPASYGDKVVWVQRHLPMVHRENIVLTGAKHLVKGDVLLDDGPHNLLAYYSAWPLAFLATIAYPYNAEAISRLTRETSRFATVGDYRNMATAWHTFTTWVQGLDVAGFQARQASRWLGGAR